MNPGAMLYTQGFGSRPETVEVPHIDTRAPGLYDIAYSIGKFWINQPSNATYQLTSMSVSQGVTTATWTLLGAGSGDLNTLTTDDATIVSPTAGNISVLGTANQIATAGANSPGKVTLSLIGPYTPATYTTHGVLVGEGTSSIVALAVGITGQVLTGSTGANPAFANLGVNSGLTAHGVLLGENNSAIAATAAGTNGQVFLGSTGADPAFGTLTTSTGIAYTTGAHALAIDVKTGGFAVVDQTSGTAALAAQTMYITDNGASKVTYTLPATVAIGTVIKIVGLSVGGWTIAQNASQTISMNGNVTTSGTGGSVSSTNKNQSVTLTAIDATTNGWVISDSSGGALTFV